MFLTEELEELLRSINSALAPNGWLRIEDEYVVI
jgi:hypothetical protein